MKIKDIYTDHTLIIKELEKSIKFYNWDFILPFLPEQSFLVGGYIRDIILRRVSKEVDVDIVVPANAIDIGESISKYFDCKMIILDKERQVVRIILNDISFDIANQISPFIEVDLKSRDFSINSIAFSFDQKCLIDPLNSLKDFESFLLRTYSKKNLLDDPLRILRCFRFVSELNFKLDAELITFIKQYKERLELVAKERINYEIRRIAKGVNALESILYLKELKIFEFENSFKDSFFIDLKEIDFEELNQNEKDKFLSFFFISQILTEASLEKLKFSKTEILKTRLLRKWHCILRKKNISQFNEDERFNLHKELEDILPTFIFHIPQNLRSEWLDRWRDKEDKLFHPRNLVKGNVIKQHLNIGDGPILGQLLNYLSKEHAYGRLDTFDEAIYNAKQWIQQNAPKCD